MVLAAAKASRPQTRTALLAQGPVGFAPGWRQRCGVDAIIAVRLRSEVSAAKSTLAVVNDEAPPDLHWLQVLLTQVEAWWPKLARGTPSTRDLQALLSGGGVALAVGARAKATLRFWATVHSPSIVVPALERRVESTPGRRSTESTLDAVTVDVATSLGHVGFHTLAKVAGSPNASAEARNRAVDFLARWMPPVAAATILVSLLRDSVVGAAAAEGLLTAAVEAGPVGFDDLVLLAQAPYVANHVRRAAVAVLGSGFGEQTSASLVETWQRGVDKDLQDAADGLRREANLANAITVATDFAAAVDKRVAALGLVAAHGRHDLVRTVLSAVLPDKAIEVRAAAVEWILRRPDIDPEAAMRVMSSEPMLQRAGLIGVSLAGRSRFRELCWLATSGTVAVRADALKLAAVRFDPGRVLSVVQAGFRAPEAEVRRAAVHAAILLKRAGHGALKNVVTQAGSVDVRLAAFDALMANGDLQLQGSIVKRALVDENPQLQERAVAAAVAWVDGQSSLLLDEVAKTRRLDLAGAVVDGLCASGPGGFQGLVAVTGRGDWPAESRARAQQALALYHRADLATELLTASVGASAPADRPDAQTSMRPAPTRPASPPWSGPTAPADSAGRRAVSDREAVAISTPVARPRLPSGPRPVRRISLARAQQALKEALRAGRAGFRALRTLADSPRVPDEVRVFAIRHLASDFPDRDVRSVLESALASDRSEVQQAALGALMVRDDPRRAPIAHLVGNAEVSVGLRMRAARYLARKWPSGDVHVDLEALFDSDHSGLQRVALEGLFPSMQYTPTEQVESRLINLLEVHESVQVRASAARALAVYGQKAAIEALQSADSWRSAPNVRKAARSSLERIHERAARSDRPHRLDERPHRA